MIIKVGKLSGFCGGVQKTVTEVKKVLIENEKVYSLGEIVHNEKVISNLNKLGMITVYNIEEIPNNEIVIFRAHGEPKDVYTKALEKKLKIIDLTCIKIKKIREKITIANNDSFILIIGKKDHPETYGNKSFCLYSFIIESDKDIDIAFKEYKKTKLNKVYILSQTTFSSNKFDYLVNLIKNKFKETIIKIDKTICHATEFRQKETKELALVSDKMIIIGGKKSSNTKELFIISKKYCNNSYLIQTATELKNIKFGNEDKIGIMAGASTPKESINEVIEYLKKIN